MELDELLGALKSTTVTLSLLTIGLNLGEMVIFVTILVAGCGSGHYNNY